MTYVEIITKFEKIKNTDTEITSDHKLVFNGNSIHAEFLIRGKYPFSISIAQVFDATEKGYVSSKWKKNPLSKINSELTEDLFNEISQFIQSRSPNIFTPPHARGVNVANVLANHLRNSDPYDRS